jgi:hypothetical protein
VWYRHQEDGQVEDNVQARMSKRLGFNIHASAVVLVVPSIPGICKWLTVVEDTDNKGDKDKNHDEYQGIYLLSKPLVGEDSEVQ